jgi:hypothetical protein
MVSMLVFQILVAKNSHIFNGVPVRLDSAPGTILIFSAVSFYRPRTARAEADPTYALRGALTQVKPTPRAAITDAEKFGALLRAIDAFDGQPLQQGRLGVDGHGHDGSGDGD